MTIAALTDAQKRAVNDNIPSLSANHPPSFAISTLLDLLIWTINANTEQIGTVLTAFSAGIETIPNGLDTVTVGLPLELDGSFAIAMFGEDEAGVAIQSAVWDGSGNLTITSTANTTADRIVRWFVAQV